MRLSVLLCARVCLTAAPVARAADAPALYNEQQAKLREMQHVWLTSRGKSCMFATAPSRHDGRSDDASCQNKETARRAIFLRVAQDSKPQKQLRKSSYGVQAS